jgi:hypothetical protein
MTLERQDDIDGTLAKRAIVARIRGWRQCAGDTTSFPHAAHRAVLIA